MSSSALAYRNRPHVVVNKMARVQKKPLTIEQLQARDEYLKDLLLYEVDMLKRLDLIQARITISLTIQELQRPPRERIR